MLALIDGDIVTYRVGFTTQEDEFWIAKARVNETVEKILRDTSAKEYRIYLTTDSDPKAFRKMVYPEYKANRKAPRPKWYKEIRNFLQEEWGAIVVEVLEADDWLGIDQMFFYGNSVRSQAAMRTSTQDSIICSIDKDLHQIPGDHYNFVKEEFTVVDPFEGLRYFYVQLLAGDTADNIKGVLGIGPKKAEAILGNAETETDLFGRVRETYCNDEEMLMNGRVLHIWQHEHDDWKYHWERLA